VVDCGQLCFVRTDHIGRPVFATNDAGAVVWSATYYPFGGVRVTQGTPIGLRFPGQWFQAESGLHQNWMRDYDPTTGRYIQPDPLGIDGGVVLYGYALQSPMVWTDPTGEIPIAPLLVVMGYGAIGGIAFDYLIDQLIGDGCYTVRELIGAASIGAFTGGGTYWWFGVKRAGTEFSHAIPKQILKDSSLGRWLDGRSNPYRTLNGNYVTPWFHAMTDYHRRIKGIPADWMFPKPFRQILRVPYWMYSPLTGGLSPSNPCGCQQL
jgi:RHS repeat-associated protein